MDKILDVTRQDIIDVIRNGFVVSFDSHNKQAKDKLMDSFRRSSSHNSVARNSVGA